MSSDLLLDTHMLLWFAAGDERARHLVPFVDDPAATVSVSSISFLEIAIKRTIGKLEVDLGLIRRTAQRFGLAELPLTAAHAERLDLLPLHHRDPFDRILAAQSMCEGMTFVTGDSAFDAYEGLNILR